MRPRLFALSLSLVSASIALADPRSCRTVPRIAPEVPAASRIRYIGRGTRELVDSAIRARDPEGKLTKVEAIRFPLRLRGLFFEMHGNEEAFFRPDLFVTVWTRERKVVFDNFPKAGQRSTYLENRAFTQSSSGSVLESVDCPLDHLPAGLGDITLKIVEKSDHFGPLSVPLRWIARLRPAKKSRLNRYSPLVQMSFLSYALINYTLFPNNLTDATQVFSVRKTGAFELEVKYRTDRFVTHSRVQRYRFDPRSGLLALHRYRVASINSRLRAWHSVESQQWVDGIAFGDRRRIRLSMMGRPTQESLEMISAEVGAITLLP